jgi:diamine N-acetyltransferase
MDFFGPQDQARASTKRRAQVAVVGRTKDARERPDQLRVMHAAAPNDALILPATEEHLPALAELAGVIWREHYPGIIAREQIDYMLGKMYSLETLRTELREKQIHFVRLLVGERFVGFASFGPQPEPGVMKLHKCYLLPEMHGRGYGSLLLQHCEREIRQRGAKRLLLAVNKHNTKAIAAYLRNGFAVAESVVTDFGSGFVMDDYIMAKELKTPAP